jgi:hypothetical protein
LVKRAAAGTISNKITASIVKTLCAHVPQCTWHQIAVIPAGTGHLNWSAQINNFSAELLAVRKQQEQFHNIVVIRLADCYSSTAVSISRCYSYLLD